MLIRLNFPASYRLNGVAFLKGEVVDVDEDTAGYLLALPENQFERVGSERSVSIEEAERPANVRTVDEILGRAPKQAPEQASARAPVVVDKKPEKDAPAGDELIDTAVAGPKKIRIGPKAAKPPVEPDDPKPHTLVEDDEEEEGVPV